MDYLAELGTLALGSRLRRLSDLFYEEVADIYAFYNFDLEPRYFGLVSYLHHHGPAGVTEAAKALHLTHPAVSVMAKALEESGWIVFEPDANDERRKLLRLSSKGQALVAELAPVWEQIRQGVDELLGDQAQQFFSTLGRIESALEDVKFSKRALRRASLASHNRCQVITWQPKYGDAFHDLNEEWVRRFFSYEEKDGALLRNPERYIREPGGEIFFALLDGVPVGTCALQKTGDSEFELIKMAVARRTQGQGIGTMLLDAALAWAEAQGAKKVTLETNGQLVGALKLYQRRGFVRAQRPGPTSYERADIYMERRL
ncbi:MAG: bifunctional helix-turn-helix transcriptional regulator/GNAT family N-acetyltransferase [Bdellovibrionales bacterium]|nr:bifunctional helix-turn-helix transcriptional regulator/GNAT family N-acetyltransferase [Bdellovibrionales bacterium]